MQGWVEEHRHSDPNLWRDRRFMTQARRFRKPKQSRAIPDPPAMGASLVRPISTRAQARAAETVREAEIF